MTALAMTANGADGQTLAQMEALLGDGMNIETLNQQIFNLYSALPSTKSASFKAANSIWLTSLPIFTVNPDFIKKMENTYNADVLSIDFSKSQEAADAINYWCNEKTDGMIPKAADPTAYKPETVMALLNALTFDAKWSSPYTVDNCRDGVFHGTNGDTPATMMYDYKCSYIEGERERGFLKYYKDYNYAFVALLPNESGNISDYLASLNGSYLMNLIDSRGQIECQLTTVLPVFKSETALIMNEILKNLGMPDAFDPAKASFTKLGKSDIRNIFIDMVIHKTVIEVNSEGTRAAAITEVIMDAVGLLPERQEYVILDRPFVYAIIDTATSLPIFIGNCENVA